LPWTGLSLGALDSALGGEQMTAPAAATFDSWLGEGRTLTGAGQTPVRPEPAWYEAGSAGAAQGTADAQGHVVPAYAATPGGQGLAWSTREDLSGGDLWSFDAAGTDAEQLFGALPSGRVTRGSQALPPTSFGEREAAAVTSVSPVAPPVETAP